MSRSLRNIILPLLTLLVFLAVSPSCKVSYSFSGASLSPEVKTCNVEYFPNRVQHGSTVNPMLSQYFTEALKNKIIAQTSLTLTDGDADVVFSGEITSYQVSPVAITGNETAGLNRFTITIHVRFTNNVDPDQSFDASFSRYEDYPSTEDFSSVENDLVEKNVRNLVEDIFNKAFVNW
jgi:hypothetical protein